MRGKRIGGDNVPGFHMKICDITQFYSPVSGGVKRYLHGKIDFLRRETDHRHLLIVPGSRDTESGDERFRVVEIRSRRLPGTFSYRLLLRRRSIRRVLERERPDIIEVGDSWQLAWWLSNLGDGLGIPVVAYYHSDLPRAFEDGFRYWFGDWAGSGLRPILRPYLHRVLGRMAATLVASERLLGILGDYGIGNLRHVPMGVDTRRFRPIGDPPQTRAQHGIPSGRVFLLYVGRLSADKNTRSLLRMMPLLNGSAVSRYHLVLVGDGPYRKLVQAEAAARDDITWLGYLEDDAAVASIYSAADLMVHPGICETYGLTVLESEACGTPVVSVRGGGTDELNLAGPSFLADSASPESLAQSVQAAIPLLNQDLRQSVAHQVRDRFDSDRCYGREIRIYEDIIREFQAGGT